jgi:peptide chain release factor 3
MNDQIKNIPGEIAARRTFAIISHPDAGKTTLTEKLLLYSGMVRTAGMVRARKGAKSASSDWMAMEQERGISITASAMQFPYKDAVINVLDTPGHQDFSEDTYRTLTAADSAIMVLDAAKGVEVQTRKLFAVCRMRNVPILTFINKLDLPSRDPLELLQEVEDVLGIQSAPIYWPIGEGKSFAGVIEIESKNILLFQKSEFGGAEKALLKRIPYSEIKNTDLLDNELKEKLEIDLELIGGAGTKFDKQAFLEGKQTPVFFGSALTNFGVEPFFDTFVELAPPPRAVKVIKENGEEKQIKPEDPVFSGFVFKIQANMNPKHRDSMAFLRICSGVFSRDMVAKNERLKSEVRLSRSYSMLAKDRETIDNAYPGDVVGFTNPGAFQIGDTIASEFGFSFPDMPQFAPEIVAQIRPLDVMRRKAFDKGLTQLSNEGAIQILRSYDNPAAPMMVAAVGRLQFDVLQYRVEDEYNVKTQLEFLPYTVCLYIQGDPRTIKKTQSAALAIDLKDRPLILLTGEWEKRYISEQNPNHKFLLFLE